MLYNNQARKQWLVGQAVKTLASHAENMGSIPVRVTNDRKHHESGAFLFFCRWLTRTLIEPTQNALRFEYGFETLLRRFRVGSLVGRSKFPYGCSAQKRTHLRYACACRFAEIHRCARGSHTTIRWYIASCRAIPLAYHRP